MSAVGDGAQFVGRSERARAFAMGTVRRPAKSDNLDGAQKLSDYAGRAANEMSRRLDRLTPTYEDARYTGGLRADTRSD